MNTTKLYEILNTYGLGHILEGSLIYIPLFFISPWIAFTAVSFYYLGRERRDHEILTKIPDNDWYKGWNIFKWSKDGKMDLFPTVFFYLVISLLTLL